MLLGYGFYADIAIYSANATPLGMGRYAFMTNN
jgi:hypothetical protein